MPSVFRAPEIIAGMEWDDQIDIWSIGVMIWDLPGENRQLLLVLFRKILRWLPEDRPSAEDLNDDDFICQFLSKAEPSNHSSTILIDAWSLSAVDMSIVR
ncbi:hypothetical protein CAC42_4373 [Sphaceloma murrayae]|uniref:Protein kinase domain-containing protein n=1 Tax=Sphaceloma murrayae TaxID=2082308 RepID=A0A2K1QM08_9PEZI|nr:hypothetical protein CAC42_4373 [Sphaceloma murrayae]